MTHGFLLFFCLCTNNFLPQLVCLGRTILPAAFYNHCLPFECTYHALTICHVITFDIWEGRITSSFLSKGAFVALSAPTGKEKETIFIFCPSSTHTLPDHKYPIFCGQVHKAICSSRWFASIQQWKLFFSSALFALVSGVLLPNSATGPQCIEKGQQKDNFVYNYTDWYLLFIDWCL